MSVNTMNLCIDTFSVPVSYTGFWPFFSYYTPLQTFSKVTSTVHRLQSYFRLFPASYPIYKPIFFFVVAIDPFCALLLQVLRTVYKPFSAVMVSVLTSSTVDQGFEPRSGQTKDYQFGIYCFPYKHAAIRRKSNDWLFRNKDNVSDMSTRRLLCQ